MIERNQDFGRRRPKELNVSEVGMKTNISFCNRITSEKGFMMMPVILIGIVLSIVGGALMIFFNSQNKLLARSRVIEEIDHLNTKIVMILSDRNACTSSNIAAGAFGNSLASMGSLSSTGNIQIRLPSGQVMVRRGLNYRTIVFDQVKFSTPQLIPAPVTDPPMPDQSYIADLTIAVKDGDSTRNTVIPFYFVTDSGGTFKSCFATTYPKPNFVNRKITLEDATCREWQRQRGATIPTGQAYFYIPEHRTCHLLNSTDTPEP